MEAWAYHKDVVIPLKPHRDTYILEEQSRGASRGVERSGLSTLTKEI